MTTATGTATIEETFVQRYPKSKALFERQSTLTPGGITHTGRALAPFPLFITANRGSHKWDVDGFEYVDYWLGHGAMLLGHAHPAVVEAVAKQAPNGFHAGGESPLAVEWAELVRSLVPSAERVRFVASGGEATQMAIRVARAYTGRDRILKFQATYHGWHDAVCLGVLPPYDVPFSQGVPKAIQETVTTLPFNDLDVVSQALDRYDDVAGVILEPGGCFDDTIPTDPAFLRALRELATRKKVLLIFDEVVTGFRYAKGGAQEYFGVTPDLCALGKVVAGGLPGGAVVGKADVMEVLAWRPDPEWIRYRMVPHPGTWNSNPGVAAAGIATLKLVRDTDAVERARAQARKLVDGFNAVCQRLSVEGFAYTRSSIFKFRKGTPPRMLAGDYSNHRAETDQLLAGWGALAAKIRKAVLFEGTDLMRTDGFVSAVHTDDDIERSCRGLERALQRVRAEGGV
jgi:glutamate-1-semialdehyde 2,1-aminomutase